ncbi:LysE family translocator [Roseovarius sp. B08]|uniref:LysE family translocator n=1 Tax=Roseovarius sp. B08 TaxID=3449223 RepID=UPI003EDB8A40
MAVILAETAQLVTAVRYLGAAYLVWLAYKAFRTVAVKPPLGQLNTTPRSALRKGLTGFVLQLSNPKAIFFWLAVASVGGVGNAPASATVLFIAGAFVISFVGHGGYALLLSSEPLRRAYKRFRSWVEATIGCFFLYAGLRLATSDTR